jgi:spore coat polysaccharide biosynthesis predicted glycosyltransferase SpsG
MKNKSLLFRVDGGKVWGVSMGHVQRCLALSELLADQYEMTYVMQDYPDGVEQVRRAGYPVEVIDVGSDNDRQLIDLYRKYRPSKIIFDLKQNAYNEIFDYVRSQGSQAVAFDITGDCSGSPDLIINDSFVPAFTHYSQVNGQTRLALGPKYFLMTQKPEVSPLRERAENVMITMGGSDPAGLTQKILPALIHHSALCRFNVVLGPAFTGADAIEALCQNEDRIRLFKNPQDFLTMLSRQDIVITAAGRTLYECAYLRRPVITVPTIEHEALTSAEYARLTGSIDIGPWNEADSPVQLARALDIYLNSYEKRESVFNASGSVVDGSGAERILDLLKSGAD